MSATAKQHRTIPLRAMVIAYGAPTIAILAYLMRSLVGVNTIQTPFNDLNAVLLAIACARDGVDVTVPNVCMGGGVFQYSPLLLKAAALPIGPTWRIPLGFGLDALFLLSLYALPHPRRPGEFCCLLLAALSHSTTWALQSANIDIALYLLVLLAAHLLLRGAVLRAAGYAVILVAAAIKFYPACLLLLAASERPARLLPIAVAALAAAGLLAVAFAPQLGHILPHLPHGSPFGGTFGATNLPDGLALLLVGADAGGEAGSAIRLVSALGLVCVCARIARHWVPSLLPALRAMPPRQHMLLAAGAVTTTFCFLAANNFLYRQIFLILALPGLWDLQRRAAAPALRRRALLAACLIVGLMWSYQLQMLVLGEWHGGPGGAFMVVMLVREALWWWLIGLFAAVILCFLWDSPTLGHWRTRSAG